MSSQERLDLNVSTTFVELAVTSANMWGKEGQVLLQKARGSFAPYRIKNRTGSPLFVWSDDDASRDSKDAGAVKIANDQTVDWRFDDWKTMREASELVRSSSAVFTLFVACLNLRTTQHWHTDCRKAMGSAERYSSGQRRRIYVFSSPSDGEIR